MTTEPEIWQVRGGAVQGPPIQSFLDVFLQLRRQVLDTSPTRLNSAFFFRRVLSFNGVTEELTGKVGGQTAEPKNSGGAGGREIFKNLHSDL